MRSTRGLTLLEVVLALLLFSMMSVMLMSSRATALDETLRAEIERDIAYLLSYRMAMVRLMPEDYDEVEEGEFPAAEKSARFLDEDEIFGKQYAGYTWEVEKKETIGAGSDSAVQLEGDQIEPLFDEEGGTSSEGESGGEEAEEVEAGQVDRMLFIRVTVFPPGYDPSADPGEARLGPRTSWTAIPIVEEEEEDQ